MSERLFRGQHVFLPGGPRPAALRVRDGRIAAIEDVTAAAGSAEVVDAAGLMMLPGLVDTHVHVNEPGRTEWEGFESATRAAAAGGVTTILDMPLNSIPATTSPAALRAKLDAARGKCRVDVGFIGGVVPENAGELQALADAGVLAWKCFLVDSGVPEFAAVDELVLRKACPLLRLLGLPLMVHAELPGPIERAQVAGPVSSYRRYAATRPDDAEVEAARLMTALSREFGVRMHIVHLSSRRALLELEHARASGVAVSVETCPHYLTFIAEEIPDGATEFKCAPPIRSAHDREALWQGLERGAIDIVVTDHSPCPPALKRQDAGDFMAAWGGIASLQVGLSAVWTAARARGIALARVVQWIAAGPADLAGLARKGRLNVGADADLVFFDPDVQWTVDGRQLHHRHPVTPYHGMRLNGRVRATYLRGEQVFADGESVAQPSGMLLLRNSPTLTT